MATLFLAVTTACASDRQTAERRESTRIELAIERAVSERVRVPIRARCAWLPPACRVFLPDRSTLDVRLGVRDGEIEWRLDGALVLADDLEAYLRDALAEMGAPQVARCGARIRSVAPGDDVQCALQNGGRAFVVVNADGTTAVEIVLDRAAGEARSEVITTERDEMLLQMSRKLEHADGDEED